MCVSAPCPMLVPLPTPPQAGPVPEAGHAHVDGRGFRLGIFDSGLGGLSVLRAIQARLPQADLLYVADSGHAPYGDRDDAFVVQRSTAVARFLTGHRIDALVVACNTATAAAVHELRALWPDLPVIGVEPGVKPAVHHSLNKRVGVLATPVTLASGKFQRLAERFAQEATLVAQPCPGLAREIEKGELDSPQLRALVAQFCDPLKAAGVDTVVLGCTHYPLIEPLLARRLGPQVRIIDTSEAVARHVAHTLGSTALQAESTSPPATRSPGEAPAGAATVDLWSSGDPGELSRAARHWLGVDAIALPLPG